jgi:hypothetical protein
MYKYSECSQDPSRSYGDVSPSPLDQRGVTRIKTWIAECESSHPDCAIARSHERTSTELLPARLVNIEEHSNDLLRLVSPVGPVRYVALSYCWGASEQSKTISTNLRSREQQLSVSGLPQTLQDAIHLTQALGLQFVWIDSLCIVQDDLQEWAVESSKMASIYANAWVVVAATAAADCASGFVSNREEHLKIAPEQLPRKLATVSARRITSHHQHGSLYPLAVQPLAQRAWVMRPETPRRKPPLVVQSHIEYQESACLYCSCTRNEANGS